MHSPHIRGAGGSAPGGYSRGYDDTKPPFGGWAVPGAVQPAQAGFVQFQPRL